MGSNREQIKCKTWCGESWQVYRHKGG